MKVIDSLNIDNFHIIGHSIGGMIGTLLLDKIPDRVLSILNFEGNLLMYDCGTSKEVSDLDFEKFKNQFYNQIKEKNKARLQYIGKVPDYSFYYASKSIVEYSDGRLLDIFLKSDVKKLFVYGDKNKFKAEPLVGSDVQSTEIPNSDHFMFSDNLDECYNVIREFLSGQ